MKPDSSQRYTAKGQEATVIGCGETKCNWIEEGGEISLLEQLTMGTGSPGRLLTPLPQRY